MNIFRLTIVSAFLMLTVIVLAQNRVIGYSFN